MSPAAVPHGTAGGYTNHYCRCDECRGAMNRYQRERYQRPCVRGCGRLAWHGPGARRRGVCATCASAERATAEHGTTARYRRCKCDLCREASRVAKARWRAEQKETS